MKLFRKGKTMNPAALSAAIKGDLLNALVASTPGGIEQQEAHGQKTMIAAEMIPKEINGSTREQLEGIGFQFGADVDELFVHCTLPPGWRKVPTDHSMHSNLFDDKGRVRAGIFYKAAFYDRRADMNMCTRYNVSKYEDGSSEGRYRCVVKDGEAVIFDAGEWQRSDYRLGDSIGIAAKKWLDDNFPLWSDPLAYWTDQANHRPKIPA